MGNLNTPICATITGGNTGVPTCQIKPGTFVGALLVPKGHTFTATESVALATEIQAACRVSGSGRIYPIWRFAAIEDKSSETKENTLGYGGVTLGAEGKPRFIFRYLVGGVFLSNQLRKFNNLVKDVLYFDENFILWGKTVAGKLGGYSLDFVHALPYKPANGTDDAQFNIEFAHAKSSEMNESLGYVKFEEDPEGLIQGNLDLEVYQIAVVAGKATVGLRTVGDKTDIYTAFDDAFAVVGAWVVTDSSDGSAITPSAVAKNATDGGWDISFTHTGAATIQTASATALAVLHIGEAPDSGYESDILTVTMPAP